MERRCESCLETYYYGKKRLCPRCISVYHQILKQKIIKVGDYTFVEFIKSMHNPKIEKI